MSNITLADRHTSDRCEDAAGPKDETWNIVPNWATRAAARRREDAEDWAFWLGAWGEE